MKKITQKQIISYFIPLTIISVLTIISSCSSDSSKSNSIETTVLDELSDTTKYLINLEQILAWDSIRKDTSEVRKIFGNSRNKFSFKPNSSFNENTIHVYLGYNVTTKSLNFTFISRETDKINNTSYLNNKGILPVLEPGDFESYKGRTDEQNNLDTISWSIAEQRVKNWKKDNIRQIWINNQFKEGEESTIFQAFVINGIDFEIDAKHDCYFALKSDTIIDDSKSTNTITYTADLIIVNTEMRKIISLTKELEDVTAPIPPFKPIKNPETNKDNFGLLETLKIQ